MGAICASETRSYNPEERRSLFSEGVAAGGHVLLGSPYRISVRTGTRPDLALDAKANFWSTSLGMRSVAACNVEEAGEQKLRTKHEEQGRAEEIARSGTAERATIAQSV